MLEIFKLLGTVAIDNANANKSIDETTDKASSLGEKLKNGIGTAAKWGTAVVGGAVAVGTAFVALAESTREYRTEMGKLETAFEVANHSTEAARDTYTALNAVLGDSGQAVEAANHLAKLCETEQELQAWTDICTGVYATFGASLPIEGLTESANETAKVGQVTGSLADALNWAGISEDAFNEKLALCSTEQERQKLITETLTGVYKDASEQYKENNKDVLASNEAHDRLTNVMAKFGAVVEPIITTVINLVADCAEKVLDFAETASEHFPEVQKRIQALWNGAKDVWERVGKPVWEFVQKMIGIVRDEFSRKMPEIREFVSKCFSDIKSFWDNNLKPCFEAIGNFIENVLAPVFEAVFKGKIAVAVDTAFKLIQDLWNNMLKPVLTGITDFLTGVFTLNFQQAFSGLMSIIEGIWGGLVSVIKTPINAAISLINNFIRGLNKVQIPDWVPGVGGAGINIPEIPLLAKGGVLKRGQVGLLEGSGAEAVVPLEQNTQWISAVASEMSAMGGNETNKLLAKLLSAIQSMDDTLEDKFVEALATMRFDISSREFARMVKAVN